MVALAEKAFKVDVDGDVVDGFNAFSDALGMKNKAVAERLLRYFLAQPDPVRRYMLGLVNGDEAAAINQFAESLAKIEPQTGGLRKAAAHTRTPYKGVNRMPKRGGNK